MDVGCNYENSLESEQLKLSCFFYYDITHCTLDNRLYTRRQGQIFMISVTKVQRVDMDDNIQLFSRHILPTKYYKAIQYCILLVEIIFVFARDGVPGWVAIRTDRIRSKRNRSERQSNVLVTRWRALFRGQLVEFYPTLHGLTIKIDLRCIVNGNWVEVFKYETTCLMCAPDWNNLMLLERRWFSAIHIVIYALI